MNTRIRCVIMRGGTSKALFFAQSDLPADPTERDRVMLGALGSPDVRQIDGLGGADPLTSKLAIIAPSRRNGVDVEYTFGQVSIVSPEINYTINCGNISSAVGPYAIDEGLVEPESPYTRVRIFNTNTQKLIVAQVPVENGRAKSEGTLRIAGVPGQGAEIRLEFHDPMGAVTGFLLPTGQAVDELRLPGKGSLRLSIVDCGNLYAFVKADTFSLTAVELPEELESRPGFLSTVQAIREAVVEVLHRREKIDEKRAQGLRTGLKVAIVGPPISHQTLEGCKLSKEAMDVVARIINPGRVHKAFALTGAICLAAAAAIRGTVVWETIGAPMMGDREFRIGHPQGVIDAAIGLRHEAQGVAIKSAQVKRTARRLMEGFVYIPGAESSPLDSRCLD